MKHWISTLALSLLALAFTLWAIAALWIDAAPWIALIYVATQVLLMLDVFWIKRLSSFWRRLVKRPDPPHVPFSPWREVAKRWSLSALLVLGGWMSFIQPSDDREWALDYRYKPIFSVDGSQVTIQDFRDFRYPEGQKVIPEWKTVQVSVDDLVSLDLFLDYWSSPYIAHPMLSFGFKDGQQLVCSIETRREVHETYSSVKGFFRQFELIYLAGSESDLLNLRVHHREEKLYWYPIRISESLLKETFMDFMKRFDELAKYPEFYHAITSNCTTNLRSQSSSVRPWDYRILINGLMDQMFFDRGFIQVDPHTSFEEYKKGRRIDRTKLDRSLTGEAFSREIRAAIVKPDPR